MRAISVGDLVSALGDAGLGLLSSPSGSGLAVRQVVLHDPRTPLPTSSGGMLLLAGLGPESEDATAAVRAAAAREFSALVVRPGDQPVDSLAAECDRCGIALLGIHDDVEWLHLASLVGTLLGGPRDVDESGSSLGDLFALANAIAAAVGGATAVEDLSRRVLAYSTVPGQTIDPDRREGILGRQVPDLPENEEQYRELYRASGTVRFAAEPPALPRLAVAVRAGTETLGSLWAVDADGLAPSAEQILAAAAPIAALHLLRARDAEDLARQQRSELVRGLLAGELPVGPTLARLGLDAAGPFVVLAFTPRDAAEQQAHRLPGLLDLQLEARLGRTAACVVSGVSYVLAAGARLGDSRRLSALAADVVSTAHSSLRLYLVAAVGRVVVRPDSVSTSHADADRVLARLLSEPARGPVASAPQLATVLALERVATLLAEDPVTRLTAGAAVLDHDATQGTGHADLLRAWLDHGRDVAATATALGVHPNTVRYRLRRVAQTLDVDLADPDEALLLWLVLRSAPTPPSRNTPSR